MKTKILVIIAVVAALVLGTVGSFTATAFASSAFGQCNEAVHHHITGESAVDISHMICHSPLIHG